MKVFISWSGEASCSVAEILRKWLPRVIQSIRPWMSDTDISVGSRWLSEVSHELEGTSVGIICVTKSNINSPWLHFEAGALSKTLDQSRVCPIGFNLKPGQITGPLSQFQAVTANEEGIFRVLITLNKLMEDRALPDAELKEIFKVWWPSLFEDLNGIPDELAPSPVRQVEDQLEELLQLSREQLRRENLRLEAVKLRDEKFDEIFQLMEKSASAIEPIQKSAGALHAELLKYAKKLYLSNNDKNININIEDINQILGALSSRLDIPQALDLARMTALVKTAKEESKSLTNSLLSQSGTPSSPSSAGID